MGSQRLYNPSGGFSSYLYKQIGTTIRAANGVEGKVIRKIDGMAYDGLPIHSNSSAVYLRQDESGNIIQARIYKNRNPAFDLDWSHNHRNKNGEQFPKGVVHVQEFRRNPDGTWTRHNNRARYMSEEEIKRYGDLIKLANPNAKFRPDK